MQDTIALGGMVLEEVVGVGGMAEVYRARSNENEVVAVKVMRAALASERRHREAFFREIRSVAKLRHPCIVEVRGVGQVSSDEAEASGDRLVGGTPYLVMDHVTGGTLPRLSGYYNWATLKDVLLDLLDALAHAHALGVVHRDLKTSNVLVDGQGADRRIKLADFGIARVFTGDENELKGYSEERVSGTPTTMAPEQALGNWREEGPWTDLYALGIVAWGLTCGRPPFEGETREVLEAHIRSALPKFQPQFPVPDAFEHWLQKTLAKRPIDRFRFAADAAFGLLTLPSPEEDRADRRALLWNQQVPGAQAADATIPSEDPVTLIALRDMTHLASPHQTASRMWPAAPIPHRWHGTSSLPPMRPPMGLELFGIRSAPMIGRLRERDALWSAISSTNDSGSPALVVLSADAGMGKTRLLEWFEQRGHELGSANVLRAQYNEYAGYADGLAPMLERFFRTAGLDRDEVFERVAKVQGEIGARGVQATGDLMALVDIIRPRDGVGLRHRSERERFLAMVRTMEHIASDRPVLLWIEDVQWSDEGARFIEAVLEFGRGPILVVASFESGAGATNVVERLREHGAATSLHLDRMADNELRQLVDSLVRLAPELLKVVVDAAQGNPRAAIELMTGWVQSGALQQSGEGYVTVEQAATLPFSVGSMWKGVVDRVCANAVGRAADTRLLIELAAVLGTAVDPDDWAAAAQQLGLDLPQSLIEALVFEGLLLQRDEVLRFRTGRAAEMIRESARSNPERWARLNSACATALYEVLRDSIDPQQMLRVARHAVEAKMWDLGFDAMVHAGIRTHNASPDDVQAVWELRRDALQRMNAPPDHEQYLWNECLLASLAVYAGEQVRASEILEQVAANADVPGRERLLAYVTRNLAVLLAPREPVRAAIVYDRSIDTYLAIGEIELAGVTMCNSVNLFAIMGQLDEARDRLDRAQELLKDYTRNHEAAIELTYQEGQLARMEGDLESARRHFEEAHRLAMDAGWTARAALALSDAGDATRMLGQLDHAERLLLQVADIAESMGQIQHFQTIRMNLSLIASERGDYEKAFELATSVRDAKMGGAIEHFVAAVVLPAAAGTGRFDAFDAAAGDCEHLAAKYGVTDWDLVWTAERAGDLAAAAGESKRAARAYELAIHQLRSLGSDKVAAVEEKLAAL